MPVDKLDTKLISSATVLDLSLYKNEMVQYLASNKFSDGSTQTTEPVETKALLERYFQNMGNVMELLKTSEQSRYCGESVLSSLEEQIHELKEVCLVCLCTHVNVTFHLASHLSHNHRIEETCQHSIPSQTHQTSCQWTTFIGKHCFCICSPLSLLQQTAKVGSLFMSGTDFSVIIWIDRMMKVITN